ncbi:MAG: hypothetical protein JST29_01195 [Bacteroidetes bacterium]|nr:hypothetical protein [Bacteroidota bacterium]MBS1592234.1 hypothetical protein [Bacteroidota bacterium]
MKMKLSVLLILSTAFYTTTTAQVNNKKKHRKGEFYFSWGYNKEWYTNSTVRVMQPALGNDYKLKNISAHDHIGWDEGIFSIPISIPQYNYRLGFLINRKKNLFFEINFDHTKYIISNQDAHLVGTLNNRQVDTTIAFNQANGFLYYLNNGANFLLFNLVKRYQLHESANKNFKIDGFVKGGIGPVIPHVENMFFGKSNDPHFQIGGWNIGAEAAIRATFLKSVYVEFANKLDYASYTGLGVYQGKARQMFGTYELILSLGVTIPTGKKIE